jgi:hypothetical protein
MKINFEQTVVTCVVNSVTVWHLEHGFVWDVVEAPSGRRIGVFFCTLLCGDGCIVHFDSVPGIDISWSSVLAAMRKGIRMIAPCWQVIYATIPAEKSALIRIARRLGFCVVSGGGFMRGNAEIILLKYLPGQNGILSNEPTGTLTRKDVEK